MHPSDSPAPSVAKLVADWLSLTGWLLRVCAARGGELLDGAVDTAKDTILDLGSGAADAGRGETAGAQPLPPLSPDLLVAALREEFEQTLRRAADAINEDPYGCWAGVTEERVLALFSDLGQQALVRALELRIEAAEALVPPQSLPRGQWAKRYRHNMAQEGRWPPAPDAGHLEPAMPDGANRRYT